MTKTSVKVLILALSVSFLFALSSTCTKDWKMIATGGFHTVGLTVNGTLLAWGRDPVIFDGFLHNSSIPVEVLPDISFKYIAAAKVNSYAITTDGKLYGWGKNAQGQLGIGSKEAQPHPIQIGNDSDWRVVATGGYHVLALKTNGLLFAWGTGAIGQQTTSGFSSSSLSPLLIMPDTQWKSISATSYASFAIRMDDALFGWGKNEQGQLGDGTLSPSSIPIRVGGQDKTFSKVSAGEYHTLAIDTSGNLFTWGDDNARQLGDDSKTRNILVPITPKNLTSYTFKAISAGKNYSLALTTSGILYAFGENTIDGILGKSSLNTVVTPFMVGTEFTWTDISAGVEHAFGLTNDSAIMGWGMNDKGQLGDGTVISQSSPQFCRLPPGPSPPPPSSSGLMTFFIIVVVVLVIGGALFYLKKRNDAKQMADTMHSLKGNQQYV